MKRYLFYFLIVVMALFPALSYSAQSPSLGPIPNCKDDPADEEVMTYEADDGTCEWQAAAGATGITSSAVITDETIVCGDGGARGVKTCTTATTGTVNLSTPILTAGSGTGVTIDDAGSVRSQIYKVTVSYTQFDAASTAHDLTIATMPAKTIIHSVIGDVTTAFVCASVCTTATLSATLGITAGGVEFLESLDLDAAVATFGDTDAEVGDKLDVAASTNSGYVHWAGTTIVIRATSGTGNWGDGAGATYLNAGSITFYILASILP